MRNVGRWGSQISFTNLVSAAAIINCGSRIIYDALYLKKFSRRIFLCANSPLWSGTTVAQSAAEEFHEFKIDSYSIRSASFRVGTGMG
jgi:hypothetical protein